MKKVLRLNLLLIFLLPGCAHVISSDLRSGVNRDLPINEIFRSPEAHVGNTVLLGGVIVSARTEKEGTYIEVMERPLSYRGRPKDTDTSRGRFLARHEGFLDPALLNREREITVGGELIGIREGFIGEMRYVFPLIRIQEMHIFRPQRPIPVRLGIGIGISGRF